MRLLIWIINRAALIAITILVAALVLFSFMDYSEASGASAGSDPIVFLGNENLAPIVYNDHGRAKGVAVDIVEALGERIGHDIEIRAINWDSAQEVVLHGEADVLIHINPDPERKELYDFSIGMLESEFSIFTGVGNAGIRSVEDLVGRTVGVEPGGYPMKLIEDREGISIELIYDWEMAFQDLSSGELDAIIVDRWIGEYELAQSKVDGVRIVEEPIETQFSRMAVRKGNEELLVEINSSLTKMHDDGTIERILNTWKGSRIVYLTEDSYRRIFKHSVLALLVFVVLISTYTINKYKKLSKKLEADVREGTAQLHVTNELLREANIELKRISMVDGLTSIANRRSFDDVYDKVWKLSLREEKSLSIIMMDIDNFKAYNDTYGHLAGDDTLKSVAKVLKNSVNRPGDMVARYGGEEFVVLLMDTDETGAKIIAERIRKRTEDLGIVNEKVDSVITISLGVASSIPKPEMLPDDLIDSADKALYKAKKEGRNRVEVAGKV